MPPVKPNPEHGERNDLYADPRVYDILHQPGTASEVRALERIARRELGTRRRLRWLEPACGSGRLVRAIAARGHHCTGFDLSADMIAYAGARAAREGLADRAECFAADMRNFDRGRGLAAFDVVFNPINSIRHLATDAAMLAHVRACARVLRDGGIYIVGLSLCAYGLESETEDVWRGRRGGTSVVQVVQYLPPAGPRGRARGERAISHLTVTSSAGERHLNAAYTLRGYNLAQWEALIARSPLRIIGVADSDGRPCRPREPGYFMFVLAKATRTTRGATARSTAR